VTTTPRRSLDSAVLGERWRYAVFTNCNARFADVTIDVEPGPDGSGVRLVDGRTGPRPAWLEPEEWAGLAGAFFEGVQRGLRTAPADGNAVTDVKVTLRGMIAHPVDSSRRGFSIAGEMVIRQVLAKAGVEVEDAGTAG
jgi:translation elongation factor EF-G